MKKTIITFLFFCVGISVFSALPKRRSSRSERVDYGFSGGGLFSGSGVGPSIILNTNVCKEYKGLDAGALFDPIELRIAGLNIRYMHFFDPPGGGRKEYRKTFKVKPLVHYTILYRDSYIKKEDFYYDANDIRQIRLIKDKASVFEHYVGGGLKFDTPGNFYFDLTLGAGGYISSEKVSKYDKILGYHPDKKSFGFTIMSQVRMVYKVDL